MAARGFSSAKQANSRPQRFGFLLARNFTLSAFSLFVDTLRLASDELDKSGRKLLDWEVLSGNSQLIQSSCGVSVAPTMRLNEREHFDRLVVVGGRLNVEDPLGEAELRYLKRAAAAGVPIIGLCTASFIFAQAGLLKGKTACVSWLHRREFQERFPEIGHVSHLLFVEDDDVATCAGGTAAADLAGHIVTGLIGEQSARKAAEILQIERRRHGAELQARIPIGSAVPKDKRVRTALALMEEISDQKFDIEWMSRRLQITRRHLERLFKSEFGAGPRKVFNRMRLNQAKVLLVNTEQSVSDIAYGLGFDSQSQFSRQFRSAFGQAPSEARDQGRQSHT